MVATPPTRGLRARVKSRLLMLLAAALLIVTMVAPWLVVTLAAVLSALVAGRLAWRWHPLPRLRRRLGTAGWLDWRAVNHQAGARAMRGQAGSVRPSLPAPHHRTPAEEFGAPVGRLVSGRPLVAAGRRVYSPHTRGILLVGPQGSGKSSWMVAPILHHPGPAYVTSTKTELFDLTAPLRAHRGPVALFNPTGLGGRASTLRWDPVADCTDPAVAEARAAALVRGGGGAHGTEDPDFWTDKATTIVRSYLLAAALTGRDMSWVMAWAHDPDDPTPLDVLEQHPDQVPRGWVGQLKQLLDAPDRTRASYYLSVTPAVAFMDNPIVAQACRPAPGEHFDIAAFLRHPGTLYVVAGDTDRRIVPLLTALTEAVFTAGKRVAADQPRA